MKVTAIEEAHDISSLKVPLIAFLRHPITSLNPRIRYLILVSLIVLFASTAGVVCRKR